MKKIPRFNAMEIMLGLSAAGLFVLAVVMTADRMKPPPMIFEAVSIVNSPIAKGELLYVVAETRRRDLDGCTNGVQVDVRDLGGAITRLPVPSREIDGNVSRYDLVVPATVAPGSYGVRIRETWYCGERPRVVETPWLSMTVLP